MGSFRAFFWPIFVLTDPPKARERGALFHKPAGCWAAGLLPGGIGARLSQLGGGEHGHWLLEGLVHGKENVL